MTPLDAAVVRRKLRRILQNAATIERLVANASDASYTEDEVIRRAVERLLQESIDAAVDVNNHLLRGAGQAAAEDYFTSFTALGAAGILDVDLARSLAPAAGLRNRIVHEYEELDARQVLAAAKRAPAQFREYLRAVDQFLEGRGL